MHFYYTTFAKIPQICNDDNCTNVSAYTRLGAPGSRKEQSNLQIDIRQCIMKKKGAVHEAGLEASRQVVLDLF
jgi:hypothetical protein